MTYTLLPLLLAVTAPQAPDLGQMVREAKLTMSQAIEKGLRIGKHGVIVQAELEFEKDKIAWSLDIAQGDEILEVLLDAKDGSVLERSEEDEDQSAVVKAAKLSLAEAVAQVLKEHPGIAVLAQLQLVEGKPTATVEVYAGDQKQSFVVDASKALAPEKGATEPAGQRREQAEGDGEGHGATRQLSYTDTFGEDDRDLGPTGRNPFFMLEPGYTLVLAGQQDGKDVQNVITVLDETKRIGGIEARVVVEKETVGGVLKEITRDYFAISKRSNNVYYLGEDVDVYKDGKVDHHEGSWLHGQNGAHYGLMMPGVPLLGARHQQETAPGVGMDRAEIASLSATFDCPAGHFEHVLVVLESTPLEKGSERKHYARGVGLVQDGGLRLVSYGQVK